MKCSSFLSLLALIFCLSISGCGYTNKTVLPNNTQSIYVMTVRNEIPIQHVYAYEPGLEMTITNAIIRRFQQDGNLKVVKQEDADAILDAKLVAFEQEGVRFSNLESVEEYRLFVVLSMKLLDAKTNQVIWEEPRFSGDEEYFVSDVRSLNRGDAALVAIDRLARNVVDRVVEDW